MNAKADFLNHLHVRQAARVMAVAVALGLLFSAVQIGADLRSERDSVRATIAQVLEGLRGPASQAAFTVSPYLAEGVADSLLKYQPIYQVAIRTETGQMLAQRSRAPAPGGMAWLAGWLTKGESEFTLPLRADGSALEVGAMTVRVDATVIASGVLRRAGLTLLFGFLEAMALALAVSVVFYYTLTRPLTRLSQALAEAGARRTETGLHVKLDRHADSSMEALLASADRFLENQVAARTDSLRQQNLELQRLNAEVQSARREAESATQAKSQFLANMSHELRTPLNAILGYAQILMREHTLSERQRRGVATIERSGAHLLALINDVLDLSKIEARKFTLAPHAVNLAAFVEEIGDLVRVKAEEKQLRFTCQADAGLPRAVLLDEKRLRQVLLNLLGNAIKFTEAGQVGFRVELLERDERAARLRFTVEDSGVGMRPAELVRVFRPFEQAGDAARRAGGTGLGLAISAQIVQMMDSRIEVRSQPGAGSRFWFDLAPPLARAEARPARGAPAIVGYHGPRRSILIVDDLEPNRAMLADLLDGLGFVTRLARDGVEGLASAQRDMPDLILTDIAMPRMDGMEAIRRLRALPRFAGLPIIAVSASVSQTDEAASLVAGANAFLAKPINQEALLRKIGEYLGLRWVMDETPAPGGAEPAPLLPPPPADIERLHALAMAGNMRSIRDYAAELGERDPRYRPFADKLRLLAEGYQSRALLELASHHLERSAQP
ncbi:ATP-binding protein [Pseudoduganella namucuonensis]|uniref:Virulence sensor protein BvgS n=1 Tax=Pseudoduganella namucuonensis TaxID=1035707 RepID=A0A1I7G9Y0_9BURK|nr:ATP-binding protein [Pseudoduganella namucuonensis]SFU45257.1 Signal transduction histidine kinase [Pseudoduganella namucuonensis]